jgi:hypothetical protein
MLPFPLEAQVLDESGLPLRNFSLSFTPSGSADSVAPIVYSGETATTRWYLGVAEGTAHELTAHVNAYPEITTTFTATEDYDVVLLQEAVGHEVGFVVSGETSFGTLRDYGATRSGTTLLVPPFERTSGYRDLVLFTQGRPPVLLVPDWTAGRDTIVAAFSPLVRFDVTVWIVRGPWESQRAVALEHAAVASQIWSQERVGVDFGEFEVIDATSNPVASQYYDFTWQDFCSGEIRDAIGSVAGRINVYYVDTIDTYGGYSCGDIVGMAAHSGRWGGLLAHELGHCMALSHTPDSWSNTNLMHRTGGARPPYYVTEGQIFRIHFDAWSRLNTIYGLQPAVRQRACLGGSETCIALNTRAWPDGET